MTNFAYDISYDSTLECFVWWYNGAGMCLGGETLGEARDEVLMHIDNGEYPEDVILPEGEEEVEYYDDSMDGDAESALASAGWGTDEDYGGYDHLERDHDEAYEPDSDWGDVGE